MTSERDVEAFDDCAEVYESGWRGRLHHQIADQVAALVVRLAPNPRCVLDVGCGTGYLLRELAEKFPAAQVLRGIDAAPRMVEVARAMAGIWCWRICSHGVLFRRSSEAAGGKPERESA